MNECIHNCSICTHNDQFWCPGFTKDYRQGLKLRRQNRHKHRNLNTYIKIKKYVRECDFPKLTAVEILQYIKDKHKRMITNVYYVNQVMHRLFRYQKIDGIIHYYAQFADDYMNNISNQIYKIADSSDSTIDELFI